MIGLHMNAREISLISITSKMLSNIVLRQLSGVCKSCMNEDQAGFQPGRGCIEQIFVMQQILEPKQTIYVPTVPVFIDLKAAFDSLRGLPEMHSIFPVSVFE